MWSWRDRHGDGGGVSLRGLSPAACLVAFGVLGILACGGDDRSAGTIEGSRRPQAALEAAEARQTVAREAVFRDSRVPSDTRSSKRILFGDLHVHSTYSLDAFLYSLPLVAGEGAHPPADACDFARYCAALDFYSLTDHAENLTPGALGGGEGDHPAVQCPCRRSFGPGPRRVHRLRMEPGRAFPGDPLGAPERDLPQHFRSRAAEPADRLRGRQGWPRRGLRRRLALPLDRSPELGGVCRLRVAARCARRGATLPEGRGRAGPSEGLRRGRHDPGRALREAGRSGISARW